MTTKPVLLIAFKRFEHTERVFEAIRKAKPARFYLAVDGPRNESDEWGCARNRDLVERIDWKCEIKTLFREKNLGCALAVHGAISWFFEHEEEGIILEDDCLPSPSFFPFCERLLDRYRHDSRISIITGSNYLLNQFEFDSSYYYSNMCHIWGWASWRSRWQGFDLNIHHVDQNRRTPFLQYRFSDRLVCIMLKRLFTLYSKKELKDTSWDYAFFYHNLMQNRLSVIAAKNLITNIGFDGKGNTEGAVGGIYSEVPLHEIDTTHLRSPYTMIPFFEGDTFTLRNEFKMNNFFQRLTIRLFFLRKSITRPLSRFYARWVKKTPIA